MKEKISYASAKPSEELLALFERAKKLDADGLGNAEVLERAGHYIVENEQTINFKNISRKQYHTEYMGDVPSSFKVRINDINLYSEMISVLKRVFNINRVMTPFLMRITLTAYIESLGMELDNSTYDKTDSNLTMSNLKLRVISKIISLENKELLIKINNDLED